MESLRKKRAREKRQHEKMINFARHCMMQLCTKEVEGSYPEISGADLYRIEQILKEYKR